MMCWIDSQTVFFFVYYDKTGTNMNVFVMVVCNILCVYFRSQKKTPRIANCKINSEIVPFRLHYKIIPSNNKRNRVYYLEQYDWSAAHKLHTQAPPSQQHNTHYVMGCVESNF